jgi:ethanolamine permease
LIVGSVIGYATALGIFLLPQQSPVAGVLLNMAVFGAVIAYVFQMISFIALRLKHAAIERPFRSPLGVTGAVIAAAISAVTLIALFINQDDRPGAYGALVWFIFGLLYFTLYSRKRLLLSPEEEFAVRQAGTATN